MDTGTEIRDAVKIVIERIRDYPDEFESTASRFGWILTMENSPELMGLSAEEVIALRAALSEMRYKAFHDRVLEMTLEGADEKIRYRTEGRYVFGWTDPRGLMNVQGNSLKPAP